MTEFKEGDKALVTENSTLQVPWHGTIVEIQKDRLGPGQHWLIVKILDNKIKDGWGDSTLARKCKDANATFWGVVSVEVSLSRWTQEDV